MDISLWFWVGFNVFVLAMLALPTLPAVLVGAIPRRRGISKRSHFRAVGRDLRQAAWQSAIVTTMLAHHAWLTTDAIVRKRLHVAAPVPPGC